MPVNTKIQVRRGYSTGYAGAAIGGLLVSGNTWANISSLSQGEIGFEIDTGRFKIGDGVNAWGSLPYAGGSNILPGYSNTSGVGSGISTQFNSATNSYTIHNSIVTSGNGISLSATPITGDGTTAPTGSGWSFGLSNRLQTLSSLNTSGIIVGTNSSGVITRSLASGANIDITNADGISDNPRISLPASLTGLTSIVSSSISGTDLRVGNLYVGQNIDISLAAAILAHGPFVVSADPFIVNGSGIFTSGLFVGPSGAPTGVSLQGHKHAWSDITNLTGFCDSVGDCVSTEFIASTGLQLSYNSTGNGTLSLALSGQALALHNLNTNGFIARSGTDTVVARTIGASGNNILIANGDGVGGNPSIGLNPNVTISGLTTTGDVTVGGNLIVQGDTITANVSTMQVEDPVITLGGTGTIVNDGLDRGIQFRYWNGAAATGFMGWDAQNSEFSFLSSTTGTIAGNDYGAGTLGRIKVGSLVSNGNISGSNIFVTGATASTIAIFDGNKQIVSTGSPTLTELSYLSGVSSSIQTQLNNKLASDRTITPGSGLDGSIALSLSGNPTLNVGAGYGISVLSDTVAVDTNVVVMVTGTQTISGIKTFNNGSTTNVGINTSSNGTGTLTFQEGSNTATISWQGVGDNLVFDSSVAGGTFDFKKTIRYQAPSSGTSATSIPVFTGTNPTLSVQSLASRSISDFKSDLSLNNVSNNSQMIAYAGRTSGYIPTWSGTTGTTLNDGYAVSTGTVVSSIVLRDAQSNFSANNIYATGFIGNGSLITSLNADNISTGTIASGRLSGSYTINIIGSASSVTNALTFSSTGNGAATGLTFNGSVARTISYNSIGAPSTTGDGATGNTWNIGILGNAATVTNGVYITGAQTISGVKTFENAPVFNSGISLKNTAASSVSGFAVFANDSTGGTARTLDYRSLSGVRTDLGASTNTASTLVLRDSSGNFSAGNITITGISGVTTVAGINNVFTSTSISGVNNSTYLLNFIIDGGTP
jgi:hypothetical protein